MINIPKKCNFIFEKLEQRGFEVYAVGGCVRDSLMGKNPADWDFTTNATPDDICEVFKEYKLFDIGKKFGTISVINNGETFEITTFRGDGDYSDNRHPDFVSFCSNIEDDLSRRDFTMNSIAYSDRRGIVDPFGGVSDINDKLIRCTGDAVRRFNEDALRIMRAIRFSSVLGFDIEKDTAEAIFLLKDSLACVHPNRMNKELVNLLMGENVSAVLECYGEVLSFVIPEIEPMFSCVQNNPHHKYDVWTHTVKTLEYAPFDEKIRLSLLFHDSGKPYVKITDKKGIDHFKTHPIKSAEITEQVLKRFGFQSSVVKDVTLLVRYHDERFRDGAVSVKRVLSVIGEYLFNKLLCIAHCDINAQSDYKREQKLKLLSDTECIFDQIIEEGQCYSLSQLSVNGKDIMDLGYKGEIVGKILNTLLDAVIEDKIENRKDALINAVSYKRININDD